MGIVWHDIFGGVLVGKLWSVEDFQFFCRTQLI